MANRINLNQTSFHGAGAIKEIAAEVKSKRTEKSIGMFRPGSDQIQCDNKGNKKYLMMQDWNMNYILTLNQIRRFRMYSTELRHLRKQGS